MTTERTRHSLFSRENVIQFAGLIFAIIVVQLFYAQIVRPKADEMEAINLAASAIQTDGAFVPKRSIWVVIRDFEQQACFTLMLWAMIIITTKLMHVRAEKRVLAENLVDIETGERIIPQEALVHAKQVEALSAEKPNISGTLLQKSICTGLRRFHATYSIHEVSESIHDLTETESDRLDSDLSLIRYIAWAIPSVGFIGTVRGIGQALNMADQAIKGDIQGVTSSLGLAFNSTLIALFLSIILMYFIHLLQSREESLIVDVKEYCREKLIAMMKIPIEEKVTLS